LPFQFLKPLTQQGEGEESIIKVESVPKKKIFIWKPGWIKKPGASVYPRRHKKNGFPGYKQKDRVLPASRYRRKKVKTVLAIKKSEMVKKEGGRRVKKEDSSAISSAKNRHLTVYGLARKDPRESAIASRGENSWQVDE